MNQNGNTILSENICDLLLISNLFPLLEWDSLFHYTFYFHLRMENLSQQHQNGISILNKNTCFESASGIFCHLWTIAQKKLYSEFQCVEYSKFALKLAPCIARILIFSTA